MGIRTKMDIENRAKQFAPFDALTGFGESIRNKEKASHMDEMDKENLENRVAPIVNPKEQVIVPTIVSFSENGKMKPLYFSVNGIHIKIDHIRWEDQNKVWGSHFRCEITLIDHVDTVDLYYYSTERVWTMKRKDR